MFKVTKWCASISASGQDEVIAEKPKDLDCEFRLLDDDRVIYAYGYSDDDMSEDAFEPLDYYQGLYGCVEIQYKDSKTGKWETL